MVDGEGSFLEDEGWSMEAVERLKDGGRFNSSVCVPIEGINLRYSSPAAVKNCTEIICNTVFDLDNFRIILTKD